MKLKLLISSLFFVCLFFSCAKEEATAIAAPQDELQLKSISSTPPPPDCKTGFHAYEYPPYDISGEAQITIINASTGEVVAEFMGAGTLYNTYLDTDTEYYWVENISLPPSWKVDYCSCGDNLGTLSHGPLNAYFTTSSDNTNYTVCNF